MTKTLKIIKEREYGSSYYNFGYYVKDDNKCLSFCFTKIGAIIFCKRYIAKEKRKQETEKIVKVYEYEI
jgi:hypothetical protein